MRKITRKGKVLITAVSFVLITPLVVFYILQENNVFDTRSSASTTLTAEQKKADINSSGDINLEDFSIWLTTWRAYRENKSSYSSSSDLDGDNNIGLSDFALWLSTWRAYRASKSSENQSGDTTCSSTSQINADGKTSVSINCGDIVTLTAKSNPSTGYMAFTPIYDNTVFELTGYSVSTTNGLGYKQNLCEGKGGTWKEDYQDCDGISKTSCTAIGGVYKEFNDSCRDVGEPYMICAEVITKSCALDDVDVSGLVGGSQTTKTYTFKSIKRSSGSVIKTGIYRSFESGSEIIQQNVTVTVN